MKNKMNLSEAYAVAHKLPHSIEQIKHMNIDELKDLSVSIDEFKRPYYRIWHYVKKNWETGYSASELLELSSNFGLLKGVEKLLYKRIWKLSHYR